MLMSYFFKLFWFVLTFVFFSSGFSGFCYGVVLSVHGDFLFFFISTFSFFSAFLFLYLFYGSWMKFTLFSSNLFFLFMVYVGCVLFNLTSNMFILMSCFMVSSVFGMFCMFSGMSENIFPVFIVCFFSFFLDCFLYVLSFYFIFCKDSFFGFCEGEWYFMFSLCFFFKSGLGLFCFWVYYAMNSCFFVSCFLHSSGVISLGLSFFYKMSPLLSFCVLDFYFFFSIFCGGFCVFVIFSQNNFKSNIGSLTCFSYSVMFSLLFISQYKFLVFYFVFHSFFKPSAFLFTFFSKKYSKNSFLVGGVSFLFMFFFIIFVLSFDFFGVKYLDFFDKDKFLLLEFLLWLELVVYLSLFFNFYICSMSFLFSGVVLFLVFFVLCFKYFLILEMPFYFFLVFVFGFSFSVFYFIFSFFVFSFFKNFVYKCKLIVFWLFSSENFVKTSFMIYNYFNCLSFCMSNFVSFVFLNYKFVVFLSLVFLLMGGDGPGSLWYVI